MKSSSLVLLAVAVVGCEVSLAPGLMPKPEPRRGCRLNLVTHVATCPCAMPADLDELPDRSDLGALEMELDDSSDASKLSRLTHMRTLTILNLTPAHLRGVVQLGQIEKLVFTADSPFDLGPLASMRQLKALSIAYYATARTKNDDLAPLAGLSELRDLELRVIGTCDLAPIGRLAKLERLSFSTKCPHEVDVTPLAGLESLRQVRVEGFFPDALSVVAKLPKATVEVQDHSHDEGGPICDVDPAACPHVSECNRR